VSEAERDVAELTPQEKERIRATFAQVPPERCIDAAALARSILSGPAPNDPPGQVSLRQILRLAAMTHEAVSDLLRMNREGRIDDATLVERAYPLLDALRGLRDFVDPGKGPTN
jgi:hypothetical protein